MVGWNRNRISIWEFPSQKGMLCFNSFSYFTLSWILEFSLPIQSVLDLQLGDVKPFRHVKHTLETFCTLELRNVYIYYHSSVEAVHTDGFGNESMKKD